MAQRTLESYPKTSSFTEYLTPDPRVPTAEFAKDPSSPPELFHKARMLKTGAFSYTEPEKRKTYKFMMASPNALETLGLPNTEEGSETFQKLVSGQTILDKPYPYAQAYAGYQFGEFAGQLGDGRVVNLFEVRNPDTNEKYELQLKGAGKTPFSRFADGKAVIRSSIREFIASEALNGIGIPSTRALAITALPDTKAQRVAAEKCAVVCRMAPTWIRIGTFDLYRWRGDRDGLFELSDYVIDVVFGGEDKLIGLDDKSAILSEERLLEGTAFADGLSKYDRMYLEIVVRNAKSVAYWHAYGFLNGVLNTDNTSILGLAMDFGPFAFMDQFDPNYTSNHDDHSLMYSFSNTPSAIWYNLVKLGEDLVELIGAGPKLLKDEFFLKNGVTEENTQPMISRAGAMIEVAGEIYEKVFIDEYLKLMCARLGITPRSTDHTEILGPMFEMLKETKLDYSKFFVILQSLSIKDDTRFDYDEAAKAFIPKDFKDDEFTDYSEEKVLGELKGFLASFKTRVDSEELLDSTRLERAKGYNPLFLPRNWILDEVIEYTQENDLDTKYLSKLLKMSSNPYDMSKWGDEEKDLEDKWTGYTENSKLMLQCSCSS
ncbi:hypothetical protein CANARDRAFT_29229 [[Candida] arabinofermentans NRRL YB-2248]|uniref:Selenoprotein O n=1 Tax=[Candida] arabinofermentans NRRL YB-2248 TaxID=983967 RepID=A0A1E4SXY0_9ASCO|nr:hypothetical protein CANARDRAFT_29229 [[Candida] arabinofermentans NRRL YB-2248]